MWNKYAPLSFGSFSLYNIVKLVKTMKFVLCLWTPQFSSLLDSLIFSLSLCVEFPHKAHQSLLIWTLPKQKTLRSRLALITTNWPVIYSNLCWFLKILPTSISPMFPMTPWLCFLNVMLYLPLVTRITSLILNPYILTFIVLDMMCTYLFNLL